MLNLEWVAKKLLPCVISRTPIGKKPAASAASPKDGEGSPSPTRLPLPLPDERSYDGPNPACVVPPHIFIAILDEALAIMQPSSKPGGATILTVPPAFQEVFCDDIGYEDEDRIYREATAEVMAGCNGRSNGAGAGGGVNEQQKVVVVGPTRGHSVPLARLLLGWLQPHVERGAPLPSFVFLGNYIDSGPCSVECLAIVLCLYVGVHRLREQQQQSFLRQQQQQQAQQQQQQQEAPPGSLSPQTRALRSYFPISSQPQSQTSSAVVSPSLAPIGGGHGAAAAVGSTPQSFAPAAALVAVPAMMLPASSTSTPTNPEPPQHALGVPPSPLTDPKKTRQQQPPQSPSAAPNVNATVVLLRGRHEAGFPVAVKYTGSPLAGYRRLDDELSTVFGAELDGTPRSLSAALTKLRAVFAWMPAAAVVRCRVRSGEHTAFLCLPGGPSPALLRHSSLRDMKEAVDAAAFRALRAPLLQQRYEQDVLRMHQQRVDESKAACGGDAEEAAPPPPPRIKQLYPARTYADDQLLRDLACAEPYEDDEDRAATTAGILFSDNPDQQQGGRERDREPGMPATCCYSTEAAATLLARCGAQCLLRANGYTLQKVAIPRSAKPKRGADREGSPTESAAPAPLPIGKAAGSPTTPAAGSSSEMTYVTGRPKASPYDPGYRMYRLPSHVKRAVQQGGMPGSQASPLMSPRSGSMTDLGALLGSSFSSENSGGPDDSASGIVVPTPVGGGLPSMQQQQQQQQGGSCAEGGGGDVVRNLRSRAQKMQQENKEAAAAAKRQQQQQNGGAGGQQQQRPPVPQIVSLFSAPHFGSNFKSRNLGCVAVIQCSDSSTVASQQQQVAAVGGGGGGTEPSVDPNDPEILSRIAERVKQRRLNRTVLVSMMQFDDPEPLLFTPRDTTAKRLRDLGCAVASSELAGDESSPTPTALPVPPQQVAAAAAAASPFDAVRLDDKDDAFLRRVRRLCNALKDRGQLQVMMSKHRPAAAPRDVAAQAAPATTD